MYASRTPIGTYVVTRSFTSVHHDSETAAWYTTHEIHPQEVPVYATGDDLAKHIYWVMWSLTGTVTDEYHGAQFGGVYVGTRPYQPRGLGEQHTQQFQTYGYAFARSLAERGGDTEHGYFIPADGLTVSAAPWQKAHTKHMLPANPVCDCGAVIQPATPEQREAWAAETGRDVAAPSYFHRDGSTCNREGGQAWPERSQWRKFTVPGVSYSLTFAPVAAEVTA